MCWNDTKSASWSYRRIKLGQCLVLELGSAGLSLPDPLYCSAHLPRGAAMGRTSQLLLSSVHSPTDPEPCHIATAMLASEQPPGKVSALFSLSRSVRQLKQQMLNRRNAMMLRALPQD